MHNNFSEPWKVTVVDTGYDTLTGKRIKLIQPYIDDDNFFLTYGDGVSDVNIKELLKFHEAHGKICTITAIKPESRFGYLDFDGDKVLAFRDKNKLEELWQNGAPWKIWN